MRRSLGLTTAVSTVLLCVVGCGPNLQSSGRDASLPKETQGDGAVVGPDLLPFDPAVDHDGDTLSRNQGDCDDFDSAVGPGAIEVLGNGVDDNCDGQVDEASPPCAPSVDADATGLAGAMELCGPLLQSAMLSTKAAAKARAIRSRFGTYYPRAGSNFSVLSTGVAADRSDPLYKNVQPGTAHLVGGINPDPAPKMTACYQGDDATMVLDYLELTLRLRVPANARGFSFDLNFMTSEYPEWVGSQFNDKFLALLDSRSFQGNISFDKNGAPITVNSALFDVCDTAMVCKGQLQNVCARSPNELTGTGFEEIDQFGIRTGGGTGWLTTTAPVTPGEEITLRFVVFDEGDLYLDSTVLLDHFRWVMIPVQEPMTVIP